MVNKEFCMRSYLAFRYIEKEGMDFYEGLKHKNIRPVPEDKKIPVKTAMDIDAEIKKVFDKLKGKRLGIMLLGNQKWQVILS